MFNNLKLPEGKSNALFADVMENPRNILLVMGVPQELDGFCWEKYPTLKWMRHENSPLFRKPSPDQFQDFSGTSTVISPSDPPTVPCHKLGHPQHQRTRSSDIAVAGVVQVLPRWTLSLNLAAFFVTT